MKRTQQTIPNIHDYPKKYILKRTPSQYVGIAKQYASAKKQRIISQDIFQHFFHQVSSMEKINQQLQKSINNKIKQIKYTESVHNRYTAQLLQKLKLNQKKNKELQQLKNKKTAQKIQSIYRNKQAKEHAYNQRKSMHNITKQELTSLKYLRTSRLSQTHQINHSRVKQIQQHKAQTIQNYHHSIQKYNKKYMNYYQESIKEEKYNQLKFKQQTANLQQQLNAIAKSASEKLKQLNQMNSSLQCNKQPKYNKIATSQNFYTGSTRSFTPLEIISGNVEFLEVQENKKNNPL